MTTPRRAERESVAGILDPLFSGRLEILQPQTIPAGKEV
jgi:hypothetical protein